MTLTQMAYTLQEKLMSDIFTSQPGMSYTSASSGTVVTYPVLGQTITYGAVSPIPAPTQNFHKYLYVELFFTDGTTEKIFLKQNSYLDNIFMFSTRHNESYNHLYIEDNLENTHILNPNYLKRYVLYSRAEELENP